MEVMENRYTALAIPHMCMNKALTLVHNMRTQLIQLKSTNIGIFTSHIAHTAS